MAIENPSSLDSLNNGDAKADSSTLWVDLPEDKRKFDELLENEPEFVRDIPLLAELKALFDGTAPIEERLAARQKLD